VPLGLPSSVKYIDRSRRPKRNFVKREDGTLRETQPTPYADDPEQRASKESSLCWDQDAGSDDHRVQQGAP
jgi:hypothetical protein